PISGGGAMRTASICRFLASRYRLHLVTFSAGEDPKAAMPADAAETVDWISLPLHGKGVAARILRNAIRLARGAPPLSDRFSGRRIREQVAAAIHDRSYRLAVVEHFWCASYRDMLRPR